MENLQNDIKKHVIHQKEPFLISDLLDEIKRLSTENGLDDALITNTRTLKRKIAERFPDDISYYNKGKCLIVHCSDMNPCKYAVVVLKGKGLRNNNIIRSFGALIQRKIKKRPEDKKKFEWPCNPEELMGMLNRGPLPEIYNAVSYSVKGHLKLNQYGYAETLSSDFGTKMWAMTCDWENLLASGRDGKQLITALTIYRLLGRKGVTEMLHKLNVCSSYNYIRLQNKSWAWMVASRKCISKHILKKLSVHATIDNNDDMQEKLTGKGAYYS